MDYHNKFHDYSPRSYIVLLQLDELQLVHITELQQIHF